MVIKKKRETTSVSKEKSLFQIKLISKPQPLPELIKKEGFDVRYPLIEPYVYCHIYWDKENEELLYKIEEPKLSKDEREVLSIIEEGIKELINLSFIAIKEKEAVIRYLEKNVKVLLAELALKITTETYLKIMYYIYRNFIGLNEIEPLMRDYYVEDIECNGINSPIYIVHRKYRNIKTNIIFRTISRLGSFVEKLAQRCGKYVSYANPLLDAALPDGSLEYNEPFIYKENGIVKISKMGKFIDKFYKDSPSNKPVKVKNIEVPAFDNNLKIKWKEVEYVYKHKCNEELYNLELETGRNITLTGAHSIFVLTEEGVKPVLTSNIQKDTYVAIPLKIPESNTTKEFNLSKELSKTEYTKKLVLTNIPSFIYKEKNDEIRNYLKKNYKLPRQTFYEHKKKRILPINLYKILPEKILRECKIQSTSRARIPTFLKVSKELIRLLGYYIAEGWTSKIKFTYNIVFSLGSHEKELINEIRNAIKKCFNVNARLDYCKESEIKIYLNSFIVWIIFNEILKVSHGAKFKEIPELIYNISKELQQEFIDAWHKGDFGSTASKNLISDYTYLSLFSNKIVSFQNRIKQSNIEGRNITSHEYYTNCTRRTDLKYPHMIPIKLFNPLKNAHPRYFDNNKISRNRLKKIVNNLNFPNFQNHKYYRRFFNKWKDFGFLNGNKDNYILTNEGKKFVNEVAVINKLIKGDLGFIKIKNIKKVKSDSEYVYDVSVKNNENFIGGYGGICCHNSRVNATYSTDITSKGPTFTIRKFTKEPWAPTKLIELGTVSPEILAYLWLLVEYENNIMVIGGTASGKTTMLNALACFIPPAARIVSIEDTKELNLLHENWLPAVARESLGMADLVGRKYGEVSLFDLLKESFRQNPDYVIVGEVRGKEAFVLFQGMASGHPSFGTMHAESVDTMIKRLETPPINLSPTLVNAMNVVCVMAQTKSKTGMIRRIREVVEILDVKRDRTVVNIPFKWDPRTQGFFYKTDIRVFDKISTHHGISKEKLFREFQLRAKLIVKLYQNKILDFNEMQEIINSYYKNPKEVLKRFGVI